MKIVTALMAAGVMSLAVSAHGALVAQWTFDTANPGPTTPWTTALAPAGNIQDPSVYMLGAGPYLGHPAWAQYVSQSGDRMMICNGGVLPETVWQNSTGVALVAGQQCKFSFWSANAYADNPAQLQVAVDQGVGSSLTFTAPSTATWQQNTFTFTAPVSAAYTFTIKNTIGAYTGNDFTIDSIRVESIPEPLSWGIVPVAGVLLLKRRRA
jgi:hypothetical protein